MSPRCPECGSQNVSEYVKQLITIERCHIPDGFDMYDVEGFEDETVDEKPPHKMYCRDCEYTEEYDQ